MRIKVTVDWPWPGVEADTAEIEVEDGLDETELQLIVQDYAEDMIFNRADIGWEVVE